MILPQGGGKHGSCCCYGIETTGKRQQYILLNAHIYCWHLLCPGTCQRDESIIIFRHSKAALTSIRQRSCVKTSITLPDPIRSDSTRLEKCDQSCQPIQFSSIQLNSTGASSSEHLTFYPLFELNPMKDHAA